MSADFFDSDSKFKPLQEGNGRCKCTLSYEQRIGNKIYTGSCGGWIQYRKSRRIGRPCGYSFERSKLYPDVPTFEEVTGKAVDSFSARGFMAPKGMDPEVLATIEAAIEEACNDPELVDTLADIRFGHGNVGSEGKRNGRTGISASGRRQTKKNQGLCVV